MGVQIWERWGNLSWKAPRVLMGRSTSLRLTEANQEAVTSRVGGQVGGGGPRAASTRPPAACPAGRLAVRYRMYCQVQLPRHCRAGPSLLQRRRAHHCGRHQGNEGPHVPTPTPSHLRVFLLGPGSPAGYGGPESVSGLPFLQDPNWYKAKNKVGREGIIPANYVQKREGVKAGTKLSLMP